MTAVQQTVTGTREHARHPLRRALGALGRVLRAARAMRGAGDRVAAAIHRDGAR